MIIHDQPREKGKVSGGLSREKKEKYRVVYHARKRKSIGWFIAREKGKESDGLYYFIGVVAQMTARGEGGGQKNSKFMTT